MQIDPVTDVAVLGGAIVFAATLQLVMATGEIKPQQPGNPDDLLAIDRWRAKSDTFHSSVLSNIGLGLVAGYAALDTALASVMDHRDPWYRLGVVYAETAAITLALTNLVKIAVRRPRPIAYNQLREDGTVAADTDLALSFFSGHAATSAALSSTAIYLAFTRRNSKLVRWLTFAGGVLLTGLVSTQRVVEGRHFPTDVITGVAVGTAVGLLVPHLHRRPDRRAACASLRVMPGASGGALAVGGVF